MGIAAERVHFADHVRHVIPIRGIANAKLLADATYIGGLDHA
jgi:hypothetical protein